MPLGNGIKASLAGLVLLLSALSGHAQSHPLVMGYERFHSDEPSPEGGRILFNELGCVNCHDPATGLPKRKGPKLAGLLQNGNPDWIRRFLENPSATHPGTTMPRIQLNETEVEAIVHFLGTLKPEKPIPKVFKFVNAERGIALYHEFGCATCHEPSQDFYPPNGKPGPEAFAYPSIPLKDLDQRYDINSLSAFLFKPHDFWPQGRMPKFQLDKEDGGDLAAFLLDFQNGDATYYPKSKAWSSDEELAKQGKAIINSRQCTACHEIPGMEPFARGAPTRIASAQSKDPSHPVYELSQNQLASIELFLTRGPEDAPAISHLQTLNCLACHERDDMGGPDAARSVYFTGDTDQGDTGKYPPPLTDVGRKLHPDWLAAVLNGDKQVRPYLRTQMPVFGSSTQDLAEILATTDRREKEPPFPPGDAETGRHLLGTDGGLNCITCHHLGNRRSLGIQALDLSTMAERLNPNWLVDYLINPAAYRPNTLMPSFWPNGIASNPSILDGNTRAQIAAIYAFSQRGEGVPEGFPDENSTAFEIIPTDRPVVQRSFMEGVGSNAILIGFPEGVHLAFNGSTGSPAILWKGRFYDAYRTWFSRFPEFEKPLGKDVIHWPDSEVEETARYGGYRLDSAGIPEIILTLKGARMYERYIPVSGGGGTTGLQRTIRYSQERQLNDARLNHPETATVTEVEDDDPMTRTFIYRW